MHVHGGSQTKPNLTKNYSLHRRSAPITVDTPESEKTRSTAEGKVVRNDDGGAGDVSAGSGSGGSVAVPKDEVEMMKEKKAGK